VSSSGCLTVFVGVATIALIRDGTLDGTSQIDMENPLTQTDERHPSAVLWRRNLPLVWLATFATLASMGFVFPFLPLYVQELGVRDPEQASLWAGIMAGVGGLGMFLAAPVWGMLGDRFGRKKNMVRALIGLGVFSILSGVATSTYDLLFYRFMVGVMGGVPPAAMALIGSQAPRDRNAFCIGLLQTAMYVGITVGPLVGGFLTAAIGFQRGFFLAGVIVLGIGILAMVFVKEDFRRPEEPSSAGPFAPIIRFFDTVRNREVMGVLGVVFLMYLGTSLLWPILPGFLAQLSGEDEAITTSGIAMSVMGLASALSSYATGQFGPAIGLKRLVVACGLLASLTYLSMRLVGGPYQVVVVLAAGGLFSGVMVSSTSALLSGAVPASQQARAFGGLQSSAALSHALGPVMGGGFATLVGFRSVFLVMSVVFLLVSLAGLRWLNESRTSSMDKG